MRLPKHVICYFDILGYKQILAEKALDNIEFIKAIKSIINELVSLQNSNLPFEGIKFYAFSDNFVIVIKANRLENRFTALRLLTIIMSQIQMCAILEFGIFIRGCITLGEVFTDEYFVFGQGIVDAYNIENSVARFPRIVVTKDLLNSSIKGLKKIIHKECAEFTRESEILNVSNMFSILHTILEHDRKNGMDETKRNEYNTFYSTNLILLDDDGEYYLEYLKQLIRWNEEVFIEEKSQSAANRNTLSYLSSYVEKIFDCICKNKNNEHILEKYAWCANKCKEYIEEYLYELYENDVENTESLDFNWKLMHYWDNADFCDIIESLRKIDLSAYE